MKRITFFALTATFAAAVVAACGGSTKSSSGDNGQGDGGGTGTSSSSGGSSGASSSGGTEPGDAASMTYTFGEGGPSITTTLNCMSASGCTGTDICCGQLGYAFSGGISITFTSACAASPCGTGATSFQVCATSTECTTAGDVCSSLASAYGAAAGGGATADLPDISICMPEAGVAMTNDAGCYVYGGQAYCLGDGGTPPENDAGCYVYGGKTYCKGEGGYVLEDSGTTTTTSDAAASDAATTTPSDAGTGGD
jgi:hypothetical protein